MDDGVITLSDDSPSSFGTSTAPIILGLSPPRSTNTRPSSSAVLTLSASPSPPRTVSTGAVAAAQQPRDVLKPNRLSNVDLDEDEPMGGGRGGAGRMPSSAKASSEGAEIKKRKEKTGADQAKPKKRKKTAEEKAAEENEKSLKRIENEISTSKKSKAEVYLYLRVGREAMDMIPGLEAAMLVLMEERKISTQLEKKDDLETRVEWWRKGVEAIELDGPGNGWTRVENMIQEPIEVIVVDAAALAAIIKAAALEQHVINLRSSLGVSNALLILLANGKLNVKDSERDAQAVVLHEKWKTQIREVHSASEAALFLCQLHRASSRLHMERAERIIVDVTKGQHDRVGLVLDWWTKMLMMIPGVSDLLARIIATAFPNPMALMDRIESEGEDTVQKALAEVRSDIGKRIGNKLARKVMQLLTTSDGMELFT